MNLNLCFLIGFLCFTLSFATKYPSPPPVPAKFENAKDLQTYLGKLHNYYMIVGRPRFGKRNFEEVPEEWPVSVNEDSTESVDDTKLLEQANELLAEWNKKLQQEQYIEKMKNALLALKRAYRK